MPNSPHTHHTTLHYLEGTSDKIYKAWVEPQGTNQNYLVNFAFGRRGNTLQVGTKTQNAVNRTSAINVYQKLINSKLAKGYQIIECLETYNHNNHIGVPQNENRGINDHYRSVEPPSPVALFKNKTQINPNRDNLPQLLNPTTKEQLEALINDKNWAFQEKLDGKRMLVEVKDGKAKAFNRRGLEIGAPESILQEIENLAQNQDLLLDGEAIGTTLHIFDILKFKSDIKNQPYAKRLVILKKLSSGFISSNIKFVETYKSKKEKQSTLKLLESTQAEGIVAKNLHANHTAGRPSSGGDQLKYKFVKTASVIVNEHNQKRSVSIHMLKNDQQVPVGNVTIPQNQQIPTVGSIIEVQYLYAMPTSNSLYQPIYLGVRDDIELENCHIKQLEYKK